MRFLKREGSRAALSTRAVVLRVIGWFKLEKVSGVFLSSHHSCPLSHIPLSTVIHSHSVLPWRSPRCSGAHKDASLCTYSCLQCCVFLYLRVFPSLFFMSTGCSSVTWCSESGSELNHMLMEPHPTQPRGSQVWLSAPPLCWWGGEGGAAVVFQFSVEVFLLSFQNKDPKATCALLSQKHFLSSVPFQLCSLSMVPLFFCPGCRLNWTLLTPTHADSRLIRNAWVFYEVILLSRFVGDDRTGWPTAVLPVCLETLQHNGCVGVFLGDQLRGAACILHPFDLIKVEQWYWCNAQLNHRPCSWTPNTFGNSLEKFTGQSTSPYVASAWSK